MRVDGRPVVWLTIAFSLGIVLAKYLFIPLWLTVICLLIFLFITVLALIKNLSLSYLILILCFLMGIFCFQVKSLSLPNDPSNYAEKGYLTLIGTVDDQLKVGGERISFPLRIEIIMKGKASGEAGGIVWVSAQKGDVQFDYGNRVKVRGIISQMQNYSNPLMPEGRKVFCLNTYYIEKLPGAGGGGNPIKRAALWVSQQFNGVLSKILPQKEASLLGSVLLGSSVSPLSQDTKDTYRKAGLIHLLVVSGTQVSILIGVCLALTRAMGLRLWWSVAITSLFDFMLVIITGAGPSILRAAIMGEITLIGLLFERQKEFYTALSLSALILLLMDPLCLFDIGFQLSFAATWALVYVAPVLGKKMPNLLAISLAPILATSPIIAFCFSQVSFGAIVSNLLVLPWVEFLMILGFSTTLLGFIFLPLAQVLGGTIWFLLFMLEKIANLIASIPLACFYIKAPSVAIIAGYYVGLIVLVEMLRKDGKLKLTKKRLTFALILFLSVIIWDRAFSIAAFGVHELTVTFLDVGQGDCSLIETPEGRCILIDGGGVERTEDIRISEHQNERIREAEYQKNRDLVGGRVVVPFLRRKGINRLDMVILTHPHADHLGGLNQVLEEIKIDQVLDSGQVYESQAYRRFKALIEANRIKLSIAQAGQTIDFGSGLRGFILNPSRPLLGDTNSDSIVMRLVFGDVSFLFASDTEKKGEERVLQSSVFGLQSSVLKVGHHGSSTSTTDEFLKAVNPQFAVISCGKRNRYHHPHRTTLERLERKGIKVYRTDEDGAVVIKSDGRKISINSYGAETTPVSHQ